MLEFIAGFATCLLLMILAESIHYRRQQARREWLDGKKKNNS
jgi:hypothetical protein